jgi:hypothetical protein
MKEFSNPRELMGQIALDLESRAGKIGESFRSNIRKELEAIGDEKTRSITIKQTPTGTLVSLHVEKWVEKEKKKVIEDKFKDLMDRLGASSTGICSGVVPGNLATFLKSAS